MSLPSTSIGVGWSVERQGVRMRNGTGAAITAGDLCTPDMLQLADDTVLGVPQGDSFHRWSTAENLANSVPRTMYPLIVAAENIALGRRGNFWLSHPEVFMAAAAAVDAGGLMLIGNHLGAVNQVTDLDVVLFNTFSRVCGLSLEATGDTQAGMVLGCFDGIHMGGVGQ